MQPRNTEETQYRPSAFVLLPVLEVPRALQALVQLYDLGGPAGQLLVHVENCDMTGRAAAWWGS